MATSRNLVGLNNEVMSSEKHLNMKVQKATKITMNMKSWRHKWNNNNEVKLKNSFSHIFGILAFRSRNTNDCKIKSHPHFKFEILMGFEFKDSSAILDKGNDPENLRKEFLCLSSYTDITLPFLRKKVMAIKHELPSKTITLWTQRLSKAKW